MGYHGNFWWGYTGEDTLILRKPYMQREKFMAKVNSEHMGCNAFLCSLFRCLKQFGRQLRDVRFMFTKKKLFKEGWTSSSSDCFKMSPVVRRHQVSQAKTTISPYDCPPYCIPEVSYDNSGPSTYSPCWAMTIQPWHLAEMFLKKWLPSGKGLHSYGKSLSFHR